MRGALSMRTGRMIVSVLGDTFADIVCRPLERLPAWGTDSLVSEPIRVMLGGSAANFAVHATNLNKAKPPITATTTRDAQTTAVTGALAAAAVEDEAATTQTMGDGVARGGVSSQLHQQRCVLHTSVASDDMGEFVRRKLDEYGVEWSQAKEREHQGACVVLSGREDRSFVTHRGSAALFCREDINVSRLLESSHVHVAGFYNCPALWKDLPGLLAEAKARGASCSLGPQWDASEAWEGLEPLYPYLDVFMPNEDEALNISGCTDVAEAASFFLDRGVGLVVVTKGGGGALAVSKRDTSGGSGSESRGGRDGGLQKKWEQQCVPVEVVDTTGAGDAFGAGFLHVWKATGGGNGDVGGAGCGDVQAALRWGCALGTTVVTRVGASSKLSVEDDIRPNLL
ncbi:unnamed protein product [Pylaiella littoralis]